MIRMPPQRIRAANCAVRRETDRSTFVRLGALFVCGMVLTIGFVHAATQHTTAVQHGYKSETLRRERDELIAEQRRLMLALAEAQTPARLEESARAIGLEPARARQLDLSAIADADDVKSEPSLRAPVAVATSTMSQSPLAAR